MTPPRRRIDAMSGLMSAITLAALIGAVWMRFGPSPRESQMVAVGSTAPPLRLLDVATSDPLVLVGLQGKVVWVVFWSAEAASGRSCLVELASAVKRLQAHRRFAVVTAAVEAGDPERVRATVAAMGVNLPVYLAGAATRRQFGAERADPPLHVLIDADGRILALARGAGRPTLERIAAQAGRRLEELDPMGATRFAADGGSRASLDHGCVFGSSTASPSALAAALRSWSAEINVTGPKPASRLSRSTSRAAVSCTAS